MKPEFNKTAGPVPDAVRRVFRQQGFTVSMMLVNLTVFLLMFFAGDPEDSEYMLAHGACCYPLTLHGESWRLFTAMFLHFSAEHLFSNLISLYAIGSVIEQAFGSIRTAVIYLTAGLSGGLVSAFYHEIIRQPAVCAGASGAVFGLSGALVCLALFHRTELYGIPSRRVPAAILISVIASASGSSDTACHLGGLSAGFLTALLLLCFGTKQRQPASRTE